MNTYKWVVKTPVTVPEEIKKEYPNHWIQQLLVRNNINNALDAQRFINPSLFTPTPSIELPDLDIAADRLIKAINNNELIGIWGDFDVDGQTATTVLYQGLTNLGAKAIFHIPVRSKESHGIKLKYLKEFLKHNISVLLTCDTGISEHESIQYATKNGVDVLITDHHSLPETLPNALAKVNPQRLPETHSLRTLSGVGVAYKLIEYLYQISGNNTGCEYLLDLVALGTVADVAVLLGDNRYLVQQGLLALQNPARLGLQEIYKNRKLQNGFITETHIGFYLAPLLNALGRLSDANPIVEFLTTNDLQKAKIFATQLENLNERRKLITEQITEAILSKLEKNPEYQSLPSIILHHPSWEAGVLGIVANRLVEIYQKPTILLTGNESDGYFGSARSIEDLNIIQAIQENSQLLKHFGGHAMAAGLSLPPENLPIFQDAFNRTVMNIVGESILEKELEIDGFIDLETISLDFVKQLEQLAPFGSGNPAPVFASKDVYVEKIQKIGKKSQHIKITASDKLENLQDFIWWRANLEEIPEDKIDIAFTLQSSNYQGKLSVQVEIVAIRPSESTIVDLHVKKNILDILDYRKSASTTLDALKQYQDILWYQEGLDQTNPNVINRNRLHPAETLIIYTIPPNLTELQKAYLTVRPNKLILFGNLPMKKSINELIKTVAGMLNHVIHQKNGLLNPIEIAAFTGQRVTLIESICRYLQATGQITIIEHPDTLWFIKSGGEKDIASAELFKENISFLYLETHAFYKWYLETNIELLKTLITEI